MSKRFSKKRSGSSTQSSSIFWPTFLVMCIILVSVILMFSVRIKAFEFCYYCEKCNDWWISNHVQDLEERLQEHLMGQPLVRQVIPLIDIHVSKPENSRKALVLSFHGVTGIGKNYVADFISKSLFKEGVKSKFRHFFSGLATFPHHSKVELYKDQLREWIEGNITSCPHQLFVFDEVELLPPGLLDVVKPYIDHNCNINRLDYSKAIFIFLSNIGGFDIVKKTYELWSSGKNRDDFKYKDFDSTIRYVAFNTGGLHRSTMILHHLIDIYVPFLPLEIGHVRQCIKIEAKRNSIFLEEEEISDILDQVEIDYETDPPYSKSGCKRVATLVRNVVAYRRFSKTEL